MRISRTAGLVVGLALVDFAALMASGIPSLKNAEHGINLVLGDIAWFGFLLGLLSLLVIGTVGAVRAVRRRAVANR